MKLKRTKNKGIEGAGFEIYTFFTPLETRKPKRKTIPIEEAGDLKVSCFKFWGGNSDLTACDFHFRLHSNSETDGTPFRSNGINVIFVL